MNGMLEQRIVDLMTENRRLEKEVERLRMCCRYHDDNTKEIERLRLELADVRSAYAKAIESPCLDERHCTCVPALREEIERLHRLQGNHCACGMDESGAFVEWCGEHALLRDEIERLRHDIEAYRGALGFSVSGDHNGRLMDGTEPLNGIADALHKEVERLTERCKEAEELFDGLYVKENMGISIPLILGKKILKWRGGKP